MAIIQAQIEGPQVAKILHLEEGHFSDVKAIEIKPASLSKTICSFANADGGELYVGVDEEKSGERKWRGFKDMEDANGHLQIFEKLFPLGQYFDYTFLSAEGCEGLLLQVSIRKTAHIVKASDGVVYIRRGAQKLPLHTPEEIRRLEYAKGLASFETERVNVKSEEITNSEEIIEFMMEVIPHAEPEAWLKKQQLIVNDLPTVCGVLLFGEEPQALIPKHCGVKVYRYKTTNSEGSRETLAALPATVESSLVKQIQKAVTTTVELIENEKALGESGLESIAYPPEAIHEIIANALLHRDYSIADDVHIRVFDNRIEVESPGCLPAHITPQNILSERFARNGNLVRIVNKFPNPPNKDVGEGLNTAFAAMQKLGLKAPTIENRPNSVLVVVRHERLASYEQLILEFIEANGKIRNKQAREICHVDADHKIKRIFKVLEDRKLIRQIEGTDRSTTAYEPGEGFSNWKESLSSTTGRIEAEEPEEACGQMKWDFDSTK